MDKVFLTDVDDCLFAWHDAFVEWVGVHYPRFIPVSDSEWIQWEIRNKFENMTQEEAETCLVHFNTSAKQRFMPAKLDSEIWVNKLIKEGWKFIAITSVSDDPDVYKLRKMRLEELFPGGLLKLHCLPLHHGKEKCLAQYADGEYYWIEDKLKNALAGLSYNMKPLLIAHEYNRTENSNIQRVKNWEEIYGILNG